jgi:S1-C subfamily serine protease
MIPVLRPKAGCCEMVEEGADSCHGCLRVRPTCGSCELCYIEVYGGACGDMKRASELFRFSLGYGPSAMVALCLYCFSATPGWMATKSGPNPPAKVTVQDTPLNRELRAPISFAPVARKVGPSVVNIYSTMIIKERPDPFSEDPFLRRFFGDQFGGGQPRERKAQGLGSGVIVSPDGYILTANHVVEGASKIKISFSSGAQEYDAKVIGTDPPTDIAVLKLDGKVNLPAITLADSDKLEVGDVVLAVGNPFGVGQTLTLGIISGLSRGGFGITGYEDFIQTDAAINPGNSGGALVDAEGRLVGINTAIFSRSGGFQGVGFAVPINMARYVMDRLIASGRVSRGRSSSAPRAASPLPRTSRRRAPRSRTHPRRRRGHSRPGTTARRRAGAGSGSARLLARPGRA